MPNLGDSVKVVFFRVVELLDSQLHLNLFGAFITLQPLDPVDGLTQEVPSWKTGKLVQGEQETSLCWLSDKIWLGHHLALPCESTRKDMKLDKMNHRAE